MCNFCENSENLRIEKISINLENRCLQTNYHNKKSTYIKMFEINFCPICGKSLLDEEPVIIGDFCGKEYAVMKKYANGNYLISPTVKPKDLREPEKVKEEFTSRELMDLSVEKAKAESEEAYYSNVIIGEESDYFSDSESIDEILEKL